MGVTLRSELSKRLDHDDPYTHVALYLAGSLDRYAKKPIKDQTPGAVFAAAGQIIAALKAMGADDAEVMDFESRLKRVK